MKCLRFLAAAALILASSPALAQFYLFAGAGGGNAKLDGSDFPIDFGIARRDDSKDVTYHLGVGYRYNANWAVEVAAADLGDYSIHRVDFLGDSLTARYKVTGLKTAVLGIYPATERFLIFGKLGIATTKAELEGTLSVGGVQTPLSSGERRNSLFAGFGVQYSVTRRLGVRAEFENWGEVGNEVVNLTDTGRAKVSSWNLLGVFTF
jgi:OOP family OmpA-OmpF porin